MCCLPWTATAGLGPVVAAHERLSD